MDSSTNEWIVDELRHSLKLIAGGGDAALKRLPDRCCKADELALDYNHFLWSFLDNFDERVDTDQRAALLKVDNLLDAMSGAHNAELWTEAAVCNHPRWEEVRRHAKTALSRMGWK